MTEICCSRGCKVQNQCVIICGVFLTCFHMVQGTGTLSQAFKGSDPHSKTPSSDTITLVIKLQHVFRRHKYSNHSRPCKLGHLKLATVLLHHNAKKFNKIKALAWTLEIH